MSKQDLIKTLASLPQDQVYNDLAELLLGLTKIVDNLGLGQGLNFMKISGLLLKMQTNPKGFNDEVGISNLQPLIEKYKHIFSSGTVTDVINVDAVENAAIKGLGKLKKVLING